MSRLDKSKIRAMFGGKGFYIALAVCLLAAGTIGYITLFSSASPVREPDPVIEIKPAPVTPVPAPPTKPVIQPEPVEVPVQEPVVIEEPVELLPEVISPLDGTTVTVFSMTELLYDQTMADWRTHNGIDVQAEEGAAVKTAADGTVVSVTAAVVCRAVVPGSLPPSLPRAKIARITAASTTHRVVFFLPLAMLCPFFFHIPFSGDFFVRGDCKVRGILQPVAPLHRHAIQGQVCRVQPVPAVQEQFLRMWNIRRRVRIF